VNAKVHGEFDFDYTISFFEYNEVAREIIRDMKFGKKAYKMSDFAEIVLDFAQLLTSDYANFDRVIPVPLHPNRERERGFNQSLLFARLIADRLNLPLDDDICIRIIDNMPQSMVDSQNRRDNVRGIFKLNENAKVAGKNFLLIDDVFTSGETLSSLARTFKEGGANEVACIAACTAHSK